MSNSLRTAAFSMAIVVVVCFSQRASANGNLIKNGSFEVGPKVQGNSFTILKKGDTTLDGWAVTKTQVDYSRCPLFETIDGQYCLDLDGSPGAGAVSQAVDTVPGAKYKLEFLLAGNASGKPDEKRLQVRVGNTSRIFTFNSSGQNNSHIEWQRIQIDFVAQQKSTKIEFESLDPTEACYGPLLDCVFVTGMKEPGLQKLLETNWLWLYEKGSRWQQNKNSGESIIDLTNALKYFTGADCLGKRSELQANIYNERGKIYRELGKDDLSIKDFDEAIALMPEHWWFYTVRADLHCRNKHYEQATKDVDKAIKLRPDLAGLLGQRANIYYQRGQSREAYQMILEARQEFPDDPDLKFKMYEWRGDQKKELIELEAALKDYNECLRLQPNQEFALEKRAAVLKELGRPQECLSDLRKFVKAAPQRRLTGLFHMAWCYEQLHKPSEAIRLYKEVITSKDRSLAAPAEEELGKLYMHAKRWQEAIDHYKQVHDGQPRSDHYEKMATCYVALQNWQGAVDACTAAIKTSPSASVYAKRAEALAHLRNYKAAVDDYTVAVKTGREAAPKYLLQRAQVYALWGKPELARKDRERSSNLINDTFQYVK